VCFVCLCVGVGLGLGYQFSFGIVGRFLIGMSLIQVSPWNK
jgi:hypothetical protein